CAADEADVGVPWAATVAAVASRPARTPPATVRSTPRRDVQWWKAVALSRDLSVAVSKGPPVSDIVGSQLLPQLHARVAVGEHDHRELPLGHDEDAGMLAGPVASVLGGGHALDDRQGMGILATPAISRSTRSGRTR